LISFGPRSLSQKQTASAISRAAMKIMSMNGLQNSAIAAQKGTKMENWFWISRKKRLFIPPET
jgi:hypothetical protein